jgi:hypothetical protein
MQQRRLRLGDILDDYCPRERRITNHAVVAMIEDQVKQTRCTTCDADHPFKGGKAPAPRRKKDVGVLSGDLLEARPRVLAPHQSPADAPEHDDVAADDFSQPSETELEPAAVAHAAAGEDHHDESREDHGEDQPVSEEPAGAEDEWPVHRRLIRATLPRTEGQTPERKEPDFTMRRPVGRGVDGNRGGQQRQRNGHRPMRHAQGQGHSDGQPRFGGQRHGGGHGQRQNSGQGGQPHGNRPARPGGHGRGGQQPGGGHGRKRGR